MTQERTQLEWTYTPMDFFESAYHLTGQDYELVIESGKVLVTLRDPQDPVNEQLLDHIRTNVSSLLVVRQLQTHREYELHGPTTTYEYAGGHRQVFIHLAIADAFTLTGQADVVVTEAGGKIVHDSKAERIGEDKIMLDLIAPKLARSEVLRNAVSSYSRAVSDPTNELVHLYEIRDALSQYFGGEQAAQSALGITKAEWQRIGVLANVEPLEQGRHRGRHSSGRRPASDAELEEARGIAKRWIIVLSNLV